jgi:hypothetical protein
MPTRPNPTAEAKVSSQRTHARIRPHRGSTAAPPTQPCGAEQKPDRGLLLANRRQQREEEGPGATSARVGGPSTCAVHRCP